jgi:nitrogen-specific signal transduction histidine kinase
MSEPSSIEDKYALFFSQLAELINQQPPDTRADTRRLIGDYLHDIKHTLGLITGANTLIERDLKDESEPFDSFEMLEIANQASMTINQYLNLVNENFASKIDTELTE